MKCINASLETDTPFQKDIDKMVTAFKKKLLNIEIKITIWRYNGITRENNDICSNILYMSINESSLFLETQEHHRSKVTQRNIVSLGRKLDRLKSAQLTACIGRISENWVHNATDIEIPADVKLMLGLGPGFGLPVSPTNVPVFELLADVEFILRDVEGTNNKDIVRSEVAQILESAIRKQSTSTIDRFFSAKFDSCQKFKKEHPEILVIKSDKGSKTVLMSKDDYAQKSEMMLNDNETYEDIDDPTNSIQLANNKLVKALYDDDHIDIRTRKQLTTYNATPPCIYFLPKHHKPDMPLRPITADVNGPTCKLSRFLASILGKLNKSEFHVRNSFEFMRFITVVSVPPGYCMISLDVVSLFTKTPMILVRKMVRQR